MGKVVLIRLRIYLLRAVTKIPLILEVDPMRETQAKVRENQEVDRNPSLRRKLSITIAKKKKGITKPSV